MKIGEKMLKKNILIIALVIIAFTLFSCEKDNEDTNNPPSDITLSSDVVAENQPALTEVGTFTAVDEDSGEEFTWLLVDDGSGNFTLIDNKLVTAATLDKEVQATYTITVRVEDSEGETFEKNFTITVTENIVEISGDITSDVTWSAEDYLLLTGQTFVKAGATLTIEPGATVYSRADDGAGLAPALVIERGAQIIANGREDAPITFTTELSEADMIDPRGNWGGLIINGNAPISTTGGENFVEGLEGVPYGGNDPNDDSGILRYVRVWHGGRSIGQDNEINGITLAGVGNGTTIEYCEVAFNLDDGFEFFGGTVDLRHCSVLFVGDDAYDADEGYQGRGQFLFAVVGSESGNRAHEMDNKTNGDLDSQPRTHPIWYNVTLVGSGPNAVADNDQVARLREGLGGEFGNYIVVEGKDIGIRNSDNGSETVTSDWATAQAAGFPNYLYWSPNNIVFNNAGGQFKDAPNLVSLDVDPQLMSLDGRETGGVIDARPAAGGPAYENVDTVPNDRWFVQTSYKGAFGQSNWLTGWSLLAEKGRL
jgi:hypothetical protein